MKLSQLPWDQIVSTVLTVLSIVLGTWAKRQSSQKKEANATLEAVIRGVEAASERLGSAGVEVKREIRNESLDSGTEIHLAKVVEKVTEEPKKELKQ